MANPEDFLDLSDPENVIAIADSMAIGASEALTQAMGDLQDFGHIHVDTENSLVNMASLLNRYIDELLELNDKIRKEKDVKENGIEPII